MWERGGRKRRARWKSGWGRGRERDERERKEGGRKKQTERHGHRRTRALVQHHTSLAQPEPASQPSTANTLCPRGTCLSESRDISTPCALRRLVNSFYVNSSRLCTISDRISFALIDQSHIQNFLDRWSLDLSTIPSFSPPPRSSLCPPSLLWYVESRKRRKMKTTSTVHP